MMTMRHSPWGCFNKRSVGEDDELLQQVVDQRCGWMNDDGPESIDCKDDDRGSINGITTL
jgi:hypothetical protein